MRLGHVELACADTQRAMRFYVDVLGFHHEADQGPFQWIRLGDAEILLRPGANPAAERLEEASHNLVIYTDDVPAMQKTLAGRGLVFCDCAEEGCLVFQDPDGHWWQIVNPQG